MHASIVTVTVVVEACAIGGGAGHRPFSGNTPAGGPIDQGVAVFVQVLRLPVHWAPGSRVLDRLHMHVCNTLKDEINKGGNNSGICTSQVCMHPCPYLCRKGVAYREA